MLIAFFYMSTNNENIAAKTYQKLFITKSAPISVHFLNISLYNWYIRLFNMQCELYDISKAFDSYSKMNFTSFQSILCGWKDIITFFESISEMCLNANESPLINEDLWGTYWWWLRQGLVGTCDDQTINFKFWKKEKSRICLDLKSMFRIYEVRLCYQLWNIMIQLTNMPKSWNKALLLIKFLEFFLCKTNL